MKRFIKRYGWKLIVPVYMIFYLMAFRYLEGRSVYKYNVISSSFDQMIPFCEYFIVPYLLWFFYIAATVVWFMFKNKDSKEYIQLILNLGIGMTLFLVISWIYPNIQLLRPNIAAGENIFMDMVKGLYLVDTPTNIFPSIHVYNSIAAYIAIRRCKALQSHKAVIRGAFVLTVLIVLATMFLKQHTVIDVIGAFGLNYLVYRLLYRQSPDYLPIECTKFEY